MKPSESQPFKEIEGWLSLEEADALYEAAAQVPEGGCVVEIGSYKGRSTYAICLGCMNRKIRVYATDTFTGSPGEEAHFTQPYKDTFLRNITEFIETGTLYTLIMSSGGALMRNLHPNLVFIDGSHVYEDALFDLTAWWKQLVPGGRLAIHDTTGTHPPVREALLRFLAVNNLHVESVTGSISWLRKTVP